MIEVELPDGRVLEIDAPDAQSAAAAAQKFLANQQQPQQAVAPQADPRNNFTGKLDAVVRGAADIFTFGGADELSAGLNSAIGVGQGNTLGERYAKNLQAERDIDKSDYENRFGYRLAGQIGAGILGGAGLARAGLSLSANAANRGANLARLAGASATEGALLSGVHGFGTGEGVQDRIKKMIMGSVMGLGVGAAAPLVAAGVSAAARPIMARINPERYANAAINNAVQRSGMTADDVVNQLRAAHADNQPVFSVADALGNSGQRTLSTVARNPHNQRQNVVDFLTMRQAGQGRRIANALAEGFDAPQTAAQTQAAMTAARNAAADTAYAAARNQAGPVNITGALRVIDDVLSPGANRVASPASNIADDSIEGALRSVRNRLATNNNTLTDFSSILRVKQEVDDMIGAAVRAGANNKARMLTNVRNALDESLSASSAPYAAARNQFAQQSRAIDAIQDGTNASQRGRFEDTIPAFQRMTPEQQQAFRVGYADPLIAQTQQAATGVNKARPLINDATAAEFPVFAAPNQANRLGQRLSREQRMFETMNQALGGSRTADNIADAADLSRLDPSIMQNLLRGRPVQAATDAIVRLLSGARGETPAVIERMARVLIETRPDVAREMLLQATRRGAADNATRAFTNSIMLNLAAPAAGRVQ